MAFAEDQVDALLMIDQGYDNLQRHFLTKPFRWQLYCRFMQRRS